MSTEWYANVEPFFARLHVTVDRFVCSRLLHSSRNTPWSVEIADLNVSIFAQFSTDRRSEGIIFLSKILRSVI